MSFSLKFHTYFYCTIIFKVRISKGIMYFGEKVKLRAVEESDLPQILKYVNEWTTRRTLGLQFPISETFEKKWVERASELDPWKDRNLSYIIEDKTTQEYLGTVGLHNIDPKNRNAELGITIWNINKQGKGYGTDACLVMLWVAFHILNLNSVYLRYMEINKRGQRAYQKAGFKQSGKLRQAMFTEGSYHDLFFMDILKEEFLEHYPPGSYVGQEISHVQA
ncbi:MAG: GNAT family N-acetyltransferase [Candidatus Hodarchaeales archaeon]|jgi:RimJ/RimL family protein N-acetyltransferase